MNEKMNGGISTMRGIFCRLSFQKGGITAETIAAQGFDGGIFYVDTRQFCNKILGKTKDFVLFLNFSKPGGGHYFTHLKGVCFIRRFLLIAVTVQREPNYIPPPHQNLANQLARFFDFQPKKGAIC